MGFRNLQEKLEKVYTPGLPTDASAYIVRMDHLLRNHKALSSHLILTTDLNLCGRPKCEQNWCKSGEEFKAFPKYMPQYILEQ